MLPRRLDLRGVEEVPGEVWAQRELEAAHGLRELEHAALVEVSVARSVHPGYGENVNTFGILVLPIR